MIPKDLPLIIIQKLVKIILLLVAGYSLQKVTNLLVKRLKFAPEKIGKTSLVKNRERIKTITGLIKNTTIIAINFIVLLMILTELGIDIRPLIASAGILGLAIGFGAKSLVADWIAGFFLIFENQFNVGDKIQIGTSKGKVTKLTLRTVTLKDEEKNLHIIPNSSIKYVTKYPPKENRL
ncbi:MAG TPA: mechanosensitive ion channel domain-containing protein [Candidatus Bathyarchaeia archaeon]|nr:mechanosensitive ion channel domain-containing protein [Candidatus Bathyarchaeia archaeon]